MRCYLCGADGGSNDLRPYGPKGELVCFECAMQPENKATTEMMFSKMLDACGIAAEITNDGLIPVNHITGDNSAAKPQEGA